MPFPLGPAWRARVPLVLIHADLCGPMKPLSLNSSRYFFLIVDDYTRMSWVYFMKEKAKAFKKFVEFKALVENMSGYLIKTLCIDRGGEILSNQFDSFFKHHVIRRQLTVRRTPQQNCIRKRKNQTIVEMTRSMLNDKKLLNDYWAEAVAISVHILNISPTKAVRIITPYEAWFHRNLMSTI